MRVWDEPTSALDPKSTEAIEALILQIKQKRTLVLVTHNLGQARRVADSLARIAARNGAGELVECGPCREILGSSADREEASDYFESHDRPGNPRC